MRVLISLCAALALGAAAAGCSKTGDADRDAAPVNQPAMPPAAEDAAGANEMNTTPPMDETMPPAEPMHDAPMQEPPMEESTSPPDR